MKLDEYASQPLDKQPKCWTCRLPDEVLNQINSARQGDRPISYETISKWLKTEGHGIIQKHAIRNHFESGHEK